MTMGPFDLPADTFLLLYGILLAVAVAAAFVIPVRLRQDGVACPTADVLELAFIAGGPARVADAVVTRLLAAGRLRIVERKRFVATGPVGAVPVDTPEHAVLMLPPRAMLRDIDRALAPFMPGLRRRLATNGVVADASVLAGQRAAAVAPLALLAMFGAIRIALGLARDRPVGWLALLVVVTILVAASRWRMIAPATWGGHAVLASARARADRMRRAPVADEIDMAVALFGSVVLVGTAWSAYHGIRTASGVGDGGSGGDGGCGGGCGGCGS